jgi:para-nitrobenzyl esterase
MQERKHEITAPVKSGLFHQKWKQYLRSGLAAGFSAMAIVSMSGCGGGGSSSVSPPTTTTAPSISSDAKVSVKSGELQGLNLASGVRAFLGVPFAAPPVGNLRWKAPQPVAPWSGTRPAQTLPPTFITSSAPKILYGQTTPWPSGEDALYLNTWVPPAAALPASGKWPVLVWLHGSNSNISDGKHHGANLAAKGIIVVTPQRRTGALANLALPALSAESENKGASGNLDLLDIVAALQWVHDNIDKFGGDPDNVTLGGQSQGSVFSARMQASPLTKGLYKRIFAESGSWLYGTQPDTGIPLATAEAAGTAWMAKFGTLAGTTAAKSVTELRAKTTTELFLVSAGSLPGNTPGSSNIIDYVLPDAVRNLFLAGKQNDVPIYIGYCNEETVGRIITGVTDLATYNSAITAKFGADAPKVLSLYPAFNNRDALSQTVRLNNDYEFGKQMVSWARLQKTKGTSAVYMFKFFRGNSDGAGAIHGRDVNYWLGNLTAPYSDNSYPLVTPADYELSERMMDSLVSWVSTGNPNTKIVTAPQYNQNDEKVIGFDVDVVRSVPLYSAGIGWFIDNASKY